MDNNNFGLGLSLSENFGENLSSFEKNFISEYLNRTPQDKLNMPEVFGMVLHEKFVELTKKFTPEDAKECAQLIDKAQTLSLSYELENSGRTR